MNPLQILGGFGLQTKIILIGVVYVAGVGTGWYLHGLKTKAGQGVSINRAIKTSQKIDKKVDKIVETAQIKESEQKIVYRYIRQEINQIDDDRVCFTADSLKLWNDSIAGENRHRQEPDTTPTKDDAADTEEVATVKEVLTNATINNEICNENAIKHNALIDTVESLEGKMCVCTDQAWCL